MFKAEKSVIADFMTIFIWGLITIFMVVFMIMFKQVSDNNHFNSFASAIVSRYGGMTDAAKGVIEDYSNNHYNGRYRVESDIQGIQRYGTPISFIISSTMRVLYFDIPFQIRFSGNAVSRIR